MNLVDKIHYNFVETSLLNVKEIIRTDHYLAILTDYEDAYFNGVISSKNLGKNFSSEINLILARFKDKKSEITWYVNKQLDSENLELALIENNFVKQDNFDGMALELNIYQHEETTLPNNYKIERIDDVKNMADYYIPFDRVFESNENDRKLEYESSIKNFGNNEIYYIAYFNNEPIACACIIITDDVAGLYSLAVLPEHRNKGIGSALQKARIKEAIRKKCDYAIILTNDDSTRLAKKLDFKKYVSGFSERMNNILSKI